MGEAEQGARELAASEAKYRLLFDAAPDPMWVMDPATDRFLEVNAAAVQRYGYSREEFLAMTIWDIRSPEEARRLRSARRGGREATMAGGPWQHRARDGSTRWMELAAHPIEFDGRPARLVVVRDVTERRAAAEALGEREALLRLVLDTLPVGVWVADREGRIVLGNPAGHAIWGGRGEQGPADFARYRGWRDGGGAPIGAEDWALVRALTRAEPTTGEVIEIEALDGARKTILNSVAPIRDAAGAVAGAVVMNQDITEGRRAERDAHFKARLLDAVVEAVIASDRDRRIVYWNRAAERIYGWSADEVLGRNVFQVTPDPPASAEAAAILARLAAGEPWSGEFPARRRDGTSFPALASDTPIHDETGALVGFVGVSTDISERKRAEEALRESGERHRLISELTSDYSYVMRVTEAGGIEWSWLSDSFERITGYAPDELDLAGGWLEAVHPDDRPRIGANAAALLQGEDTSDEFRIRTKGGEERWLHAEARPLFGASGRPVRIYGATWDITERKLAEEALRQSEERFRAEYKGQPTPTYTWQRAGDDLVLIDYNDAAETLTRGRVADRLGTRASDLYRDRPEVLTELRRCLAERTSRRQTGPYLVQATGEERYLDSTYVFVPPDLVMVHRYDLTERVRAEREKADLEEQLRQAQKMEAIGRLAGGVAHDFNNLLTIISGFSDLLLSDRGTPEQRQGYLRQIHAAARRAADLTQQLLAFSRRQILQPRVLDLNAIVADTEKMLRRLIGEHIDLVTAIDPNLGAVKADPGQLQQVLMNLALNARDAMPGGGTLRIATENVELDKTYARRHLGATPGRYVMLAVTDSGVGMTEEIQSHLFEPFFTTKAAGEGTGLGLATVYGIIKQSEGDIWVHSEPGKGTTFKVYLPRADVAVEPTAAEARAGGLARGTGTVLLAEDEEGVRSLVAAALRESGYTVLEAGDGAEALVVAGAHDGPIDLLLTDVVMPRMSGRELAERLGAATPGMRVLYMSGYTDDAVLHHGIVEPGTAFIRKPFGPVALAQRVHELLRTPPGPDPLGE